MENENESVVKEDQTAVVFGVVAGMIVAGLGILAYAIILAIRSERRIHNMLVISKEEIEMFLEDYKKDHPDWEKWVKENPTLKEKLKEVKDNGTIEKWTPETLRNPFNPTEK